MALTNSWNDEPIDLRDTVFAPATLPPDASVIDRRIAEYEAQLALVCRQMDDIAASYRRVTALWLAEWYADEAKRAITSDPAATAALPDDVLSEMRTEVGALVEQAPAIVDELLADEVWPHHADEEAILAEPKEMTLFPVAVDVGQRRAMGRLGPILASRGFGRICDVTITSTLSSYEWIADGDQVEYPFLITLTDEAKATFVEYCRLWPALQLTVAEAEHFSLARKRSEVIDRWESLEPSGR